MRELAVEQICNLLELMVLRVYALPQHGRAGAHVLDDRVQDTMNRRLDHRIVWLQMLQRLLQPRQLQRRVLGEVVPQLLHERSKDDLRRAGRCAAQLRWRNL